MEDTDLKGCNLNFLTLVVQMIELYLVIGVKFNQEDLISPPVDNQKDCYLSNKVKRDLRRLIIDYEEWAEDTAEGAGFTKAYKRLPASFSMAFSKKEVKEITSKEDIYAIEYETRILVDRDKIGELERQGLVKQDTATFPNIQSTVYIYDESILETIVKMSNDVKKQIKEAERLKKELLEAFYNWRKKKTEIVTPVILDNRLSQFLKTIKPQGETPPIIKELFALHKIDNVIDRGVLTDLNDIAVTVYGITKSPKGIKTKELKSLKLQQTDGKGNYKEYSAKAYENAVNIANTK